jgi:TRAP transporter TAXI family solute receptor
MHVVSIEGSGVEKMSDLKGKRVSTGSPGSATEVMAFRVIEAAGLDKDKDMRRERLGVAESVNAIKDGKIDAFFWVGGLPTAGVTDLGATPGVKIKLIDHDDAVDKMNAKYGGIYSAGVITAKTYPGQDKDNKITVVQNILVANKSMDDKVAYDIVKTFIEQRDELIAVHREAKASSSPTSAEELADPVAPGRGEVLHRKGREDVSERPSARGGMNGSQPRRSGVVVRRDGSGGLRLWLVRRPAAVRRRRLSPIRSRCSSFWLELSLLALRVILARPVPR